MRHIDIRLFLIAALLVFGALIFDKMLLTALGM